MQFSDSTASLHHLVLVITGGNGASSGDTVLLFSPMTSPREQVDAEQIFINLQHGKITMDALEVTMQINLIYMVATIASI